MPKPRATTLIPVRANIEQASPAKRLMAAFLDGKKPGTIAAYRQALERFRVFVNTETAEHATQQLLLMPAGAANLTTLEFRTWLVKSGLAPRTVNVTLAALRSLVRCARMIGLVTWTIEVKDVPSVVYRDTRGPGTAAVQKMLAAAGEQADAQLAARDVALVHLLYHRGLRRGEVASLRVKDYDHAGDRLHVLGKKRAEREWLGLSAATSSSIRIWIAKSGHDHSAHVDAPLFISLDSAHRGHALTGDGIRHIVKRLGDAVGVRARPHGLRHSAITETLERNNGNVRATAKFSRHENLNTLKHYDDARRDIGREQSQLLDDKGGK